MDSSDRPSRRDNTLAGRLRSSNASFVVVVLGVSLLLGLFQIHGSSLGIYGLGLGETDANSGVIEGQPRSIRSDEWLVRTPLVIAQAKNDLPTTIAAGLGDQEAGLIADLPSRSWEAILRPHTLPYHVLPLDAAFATEWWLYFAAQILGVYAAVLAITRRADLGAFAGLLMAASPVSQWWTGSGTYTTIGYGGMAFAAMLWSYEATSRQKRAAWSVAGGLALGAFAVGLYVPWQVGVAITLGATGIAILAPDLRSAETRRSSLQRLASSILVSVAIGAVLFAAFLREHQAAIEAISSTVYPGQRNAVEGGTARVQLLLSGPLDRYSSGQAGGVVNATNQSENSSGILFVIPVAVAAFAASLLHPNIKDRSFTALKGVLVAFGILVGWALLPVPSGMGQFLLLSRVQTERVVHPLAFVSVLSLALLIAVLRDRNIVLPSRVVAVAAAMFVAPYAWIAGSYSVEGVLVATKPAALYLFVLAAGVALTLAVPKRSFGLFVLLAFAFWQASAINPLQRGTEPLTANDLALAIERIAGDEPANSGWVLFGGDAIIQGIVTATGVDLISAVSTYPDASAWQVLDPDAANEDAWNRYARVSFIPGAPGSAAVFTLPTPDSLTVTVDPCAAELETLGIDYVAVVNQGPLPCGEVIDIVDLGPWIIEIYAT